jgi:hypothetical protein
MTFIFCTQLQSEKGKHLGISHRNNNCQSQTVKQFDTVSVLCRQKFQNLENNHSLLKNTSAI